MNTKTLDRQKLDQAYKRNIIVYRYEDLSQIISAHTIAIIISVLKPHKQSIDTLHISPRHLIDSLAFDNFDFKVNRTQDLDCDYDENGLSEVAVYLKDTHNMTMPRRCLGGCPGMEIFENAELFVVETNTGEYLFGGIRP